MSRRLGPAFLLGFCALAIALLSASAQSTRTPPAGNTASREDAYRANNLGVAYLEQYNYDIAVKQFRRALEIDPKLQMARVNLAIAFLYAPDLAGAAREAQTVLQQQADEPHAHYVLGLIARSENRVDDGIAELKRVLDKDARDVGALVNLGQLLMQRREYAEAVALFRRAAEQEPFHVTATYNLAVALTRAGQTEEGQRMTQQFQKLRESGYGTTFSNTYLEQGRYAEAIVSTGAEPELVDTSTPDVTFAVATTIPPIERSATAAMPGTSDGLAALAANEVGNGVTLADLDGDGDLDLIDVSRARVRVMRNDNGTFTDVTTQSGITQFASPAVPMAAIAGDYDNDEHTDIFILGYGANALYRQASPWHFEDQTAKSGVSTAAAIEGLHRAAALVDVDHDGDLDIFLTGMVRNSGGTGGGAEASSVAGANPPAANPQAANARAANPQANAPDWALTAAGLAAASNVLLRNNGDGTFTDNTANAKLNAPLMQASGLAPTDYDNRRDIDLLLVAHDHPPVLFRNMRDGTFQDVAKDVGLLTNAGHYLCVAAGDVNKDGFTDFFFGRWEETGLLMLSDGAGHFRPAEHGPAPTHAFAAQFIDYDNDGLLDLVTASLDGLHVWRNVGRSWNEVTDRTTKAFNAKLTPPGRIIAFAAGDVNGDGAVDLVVKLRDGSVSLLMNRGGAKHPAVRVRLAGRVSNRDGVGSKVEMRAGSLWQKLESSSVTPAIAPADLIFGLGSRTRTDVVRVLWPSGVLQSEPQEQQTAATGLIKIDIRELDRKPSSCPFLYTWNGERFEFITDFMGGGEMGDWQGPGEYNTPDPEEYTRIRGDQLKPRDGRLELRVTNELEETLYADRFELLAIDHPIDIAVHPHEGLFAPPAPAFELFAARDVRSPARVTDDAGNDVTEQARALDRHFIDTFALERIRGYAKPHDLIIDAASEANANANENASASANAAPPDLLLLTGWTDYAFSSDNVAATQAGLVMAPPSLDVLDAHGDWHTVVKEVGIPVGRPQTLVVDMNGKWPAGATKHIARIRTNMRIYWDQIQVAMRDRKLALTPKITRLDPIVADLHWRGFSAEATSEAPFTYDYARVSTVSPWKQMPGRYTREGDVRELLHAVDDMFVVSRPGDEIALSFDARALPPLRRGWTRTYLLHSDGFSKEMNLHSASPDIAAPLPFHTMTRYPYRAPEAYPMTPARRDYITRYNTRIVGRPLPAIELAAGAAAQ
jgi:Tfp pilus assembly protein PilF